MIKAIEKVNAVTEDGRHIVTEADKNANNGDGALFQSLLDKALDKTMTTPLTAVRIMAAPFEQMIPVKTAGNGEINRQKRNKTVADYGMISRN